MNSFVLAANIKRFDNFPPWLGGCSEGTDLDALKIYQVHIFQCAEFQPIHIFFAVGPIRGARLNPSVEFSKKKLNAFKPSEHPHLPGEFRVEMCINKYSSTR